jgi:hypothetical protein
MLAKEKQMLIAVPAKENKIKLYLWHGCQYRDFANNAGRRG